MARRTMDKWVEEEEEEEEAPSLRPLEVSSTTQQHRWDIKLERLLSMQGKNTWNRMYTSFSPHLPRIPKRAIFEIISMLIRTLPTDKPLRLHLSSQTLLQRLHPLRPPQTPPRPLPLAT